MAVYLPKVSPAALPASPDHEPWGGLSVPLEALAETEAPQLKVPPELQAAIICTGVAILLVKDDVLVSQAIRHLFENLQLPVLIAADASAARGLSGQAFAAACDIRLPGNTSGLDLAIELQINQGLPCLLMTGETSADVRAAAQANGMQLLIKPIKPQALLDGLSALCATPEPSYQQGGVKNNSCLHPYLLGCSFV